MPRPLLQKGALFLAVLLIAWTSGHLDEVTGKGKIATIVAGAALLVFLVEFVWQLFVATYEAGSGASGETRRLKEMYQGGRRYSSDVPRGVLDGWSREVAEELGRAIPSQRFGFETAGDETTDRMEALRLQLRKLRLILMRADNADPD